MKEMREHPISKYLVNVDGTLIINPSNGYILNPTLSRGYYKIGTYICSRGAVHQLVYEAFVGMVPKGLCINHINGIKTDNHISNLEVVTQQENTIHAYAMGLAKGKKGGENSQAKVTEEDVMCMYKMFDENLCNECVALKYGLHDRYVSLIRSGKRWNYLYKKVYPRSNKYGCLCSSATTIETTE